MDRLVVDSAGDPGLQSWSTTFQFETDEKRLNSIREVKARLKPLEDKIDRYNAAHHVRVVLCCVVSCASSISHHVISYHTRFYGDRKLSPCFAAVQCIDSSVTRLPVYSVHVCM